MTVQRQRKTWLVGKRLVGGLRQWSMDVDLARGGTAAAPHVVHFEDAESLRSFESGRENTDGQAPEIPPAALP